MSDVFNQNDSSKNNSPDEEFDSVSRQESERESLNSLRDFERELEEEMKQLSLRRPSAGLDEKVLDLIRAAGSDAAGTDVAGYNATGIDAAVSAKSNDAAELVTVPDSKFVAAKPEQMPIHPVLTWAGFAASMAIALFAGFWGGAVWFGNRPSAFSAGGQSSQTSFHPTTTSDPATYPTNGAPVPTLSDNVRLVGDSETVIVNEQLQWQNETAVRKVEMLSHKKVKVRDAGSNTDREIKVPVRKVIYTLAEQI